MAAPHGGRTPCVPSSLSPFLDSSNNCAACTLEDGTTHTLNMEGKWSTAIYSELMDLTAGSWWRRLKYQQEAAKTAAEVADTAKDLDNDLVSIIHPHHSLGSIPPASGARI